MGEDEVEEEEVDIRRIYGFGYINELVRKKQVKNFSVSEIMDMFPLHRDPFIYLNNYDCITVGIIGGRKCFRRYRILQCKLKPLIGVHLVYYNGAEYEVKSLKRFKITMMGFEDQISFDKSSFLVRDDLQRIIRIHGIKNRIALPTFDNAEYCPPIPRMTIRASSIRCDGNLEEDLYDHLILQCIEVSRIMTHRYDTQKAKEKTIELFKRTLTSAELFIEMNFVCEIFDFFNGEKFT